MRGESARPGKRPLRALSASEKMDAIQRVHEGESKASVARDIGVPESTLRGWCKSEHKIRGMARNSSTPDSEAHSPASSSGAANNGLSGNANNLSSEDEGPCTKKSRLDRHDVGSVVGSPYLSANDVSAIEADAKQDKPKIDYVSLMTSMAAGMRPENSALLLQQLGLLSGATGTMAKNLLGMSTPGLSTHGGVSGTPVGLVENGLRYTKSSNATAAAVAAAAVAAAAAAGVPPSTNATGLVGMGSSVGGSNVPKRHGISAIAPTQMDSLSKSSCGRKSLPAAAEAPMTPVPASPRKTTDGTSYQRSSGSSGIPSRSNGRRDGGSGGSTGHNKRVDEALWLWLTQQQQLLGQQSAAFNPSVNQQDGSWFWQWYKQCSFPLLTSTPITPIGTPLSRKSPSKARAMLDNVLCNNNNNEEAEKRAANPEDENAQPQPADDVPATSEEAIEHAEKFFKWLDRCSDPSVTRLQIMQFKYLLDNLKTCRKKSPTVKHSRK